MLIKETCTKYHLYSVEDLLQDDYFVYSMTNQTKESEDFWRKMIVEGKVDEETYDAANCFINIFQVKPKTMDSEEIGNVLESIEATIHQNEIKKRNRLRTCFSLAASVTILLVCSLGLHYYRIPNDTVHENIKNVKVPDMTTDHIRLILADNETVSLECKEARIVYDDEEIVINDQKTDLKNKPADSQKQIAYNQIIVPFGKRSMLTFSEGSRIWINAGTRVVYPVVFSKDNREVYIDGEAYMEVSHDKSRPFIVKTKELEVEVLGTSFNVSSYGNDSSQSIVLITGSVKINSDRNKEVILSPGQMYSYNEGSVTVQSVITDNYVSWASGFYQYESEKMEVIIKRLSHYYGKEIECSFNIAGLKCSGKLDLKEDMESVLNSISRTAPVKWNRDNGKYSIVNK